VERLAREGELSDAARRRLVGALGSEPKPRYKTAEDVEFLADLIRRHGSAHYAQERARRRALRARRTLERIATRLVPSVHLEFLHGLVDFVVERDH
jgi:geranylgeranyl pyrophosphate synthase